MDQRPGEEPLKPAEPAKKPIRLQSIIALVACAGAIFWAYRSTLENMKPSTQWVRLIRKGDIDDRQVAARQLGDSMPEEIGIAIPALLAAMGDPAEPVRAAVVLGLGTAELNAIKTGASGVDVKAVAGVLVKALSDPATDVRGAACSAISDLAFPKDVEFPAQPAEVASAMAGLLDDPSPMVRQPAQMALSRIANRWPLPPPAALVGGVAGWPLKESRASAAAVLGAFRNEPGPTVEALTKALADKEPEVRSNAAAALGAFGVDASAAVSALVANLSDSYTPPPPPTTLGRLVASAAPGGGGGGDGNPGSMNVPTDPAVQAATAIGRIESARVAKGENPPADVVEALKKALESAREDLKKAAAEAIQRIGKGASALVPSLIQGLVDATSKPEAGFGPTAASLLGEIAPGTDRAGEAILALTAALDAKDLGIRSAVAISLGKFGPPASAAVPRLREIAQAPGENPNLVRMANSAADRIEGKTPPASARRKGQGRGRGR